MKIIFPVIMILMIPSCHKFGHVRTALLLWRVQKYGVSIVNIWEDVSHIVTLLMLGTEYSSLLVNAMPADTLAP